MDNIKRPRMKVRRYEKQERNHSCDRTSVEELEEYLEGRTHDKMMEASATCYACFHRPYVSRGTRFSILLMHLDI